MKQIIYVDSQLKTWLKANKGQKTYNEFLKEKIKQSTTTKDLSEINTVLDFIFDFYKKKRTGTIKEDIMEIFRQQKTPQQKTSTNTNFELSWINKFNSSKQKADYLQWIKTLTFDEIKQVLKHPSKEELDLSELRSYLPEELETARQIYLDEAGEEKTAKIKTINQKIIKGERLSPEEEMVILGLPTIVLSDEEYDWLEISRKK